MQDKSNNEVSRDILVSLDEHYPKAVKFADMVQNLGIDEKVVFKNLFFLEENHLVQLMSSYPTGATYPTIHMVKIRDEGKALLVDEDQLDALFPLKGFSSRLDMYKINSLTLSEILEALSSMIEDGELEVTGESILKDLKGLSASPAVSGVTLGNIFEKL